MESKNSDKKLPPIIAITGTIGSGKSTLLKHLVHKYGYVEINFADALKEIGAIFGFTHEQLYGTQEQKLEIHSGWNISARTFLQKVGTEIFRDNLQKAIPSMNLPYGVWVDIVCQKFTKLRKDNPQARIVIGDLRFLNEARFVRDYGGIIVRTLRNNKVSSASGVEFKHASELELNSIDPNFVIDNDKYSIKEAQRQIDEKLKICSGWDSYLK